MSLNETIFASVDAAPAEGYRALRLLQPTGDAPGKGPDNRPVVVLTGTYGARILGPLPPPFGHATAYAAAVSAGSPRGESARAFIAALTAPASRDVWVKAGFEVG